MKRLFASAALLVFCHPLIGASLTLDRAIPLPGVEGRIDHFALDTTGRRLFVAALGNNSVEVIDLKTGQVVHSITGLAEPQGIFYLGELNRLYVANGGGGVLRVFHGGTFVLVATVKFDDDADNVRYDAAAKRLYVGHGRGALGAIDVTTNRIVVEVPLKAHPESFQLEKRGGRIFVNVPDAAQVAVVDREKNSMTGSWPLGLTAANFPMALDEDNHRLMIGCRRPAGLIVFDTDSGREVARLALHGDCDDLFLDGVRRQLYASCGEGFIDVFTQLDADHYALKEAVQTEAKARTSFIAGDELYLAVPKRGDRPAELRCYHIGK